MNGLRLGGMERQLVELIKALAGSPVKAHLAILNSRGPYSDFVEQYLESPVIYLDRRKSKIPSTLRTLNKIIRDIQIDLIHVQDGFSCFYAFPVTKWNRIPLINGLIRHAGVSKGPDFWYEKTLLFFSDIIIANSKSGLRYFNIQRGHVIYNLIEPARFTPAHGSLQNIVMNANFHHLKDHQTFFDAMRILHKENRINSIGLIGDGPNKFKYQQLASEYGLNDLVTFYGFINNVEEVLPNYGIGVLCSTRKYEEGVSNAILEYMSCGLISVASDVGATSEIIRDGENGFLFEVENATSLVNKIIYVQDNQNIALKVTENAYLSIRKNHSPIINANSYMEIVNQYFT